MSKKLMKGCEAIGEAAIYAGAKNYFCYPITPQSEVAEYLSRRMPEVGGVFLQAESEVAASNMLFGAGATGVRAFTTSSSPGISLMSEAISYITAAELPVVFVNIVRAGPGLGGILPAQGDYFQATKGGGHGDYRLMVLAPSTVQEAVDLTILAFDKADEYRNPVMVLGDGMIGQMMEPVEFPENYKPKYQDHSGWATTGCEGREPHIVKTLFLDPALCDKHNEKMAAKYRRFEESEIRYEEYNMDGEYEVLIVSYGTMARICKTAIEDLSKKGIKVGLLRPISLYPFPREAVLKAADRKHVKAVASIEMSMGQMVEDVERAVAGTKKVSFFGHAGGIVPTPDEIIEFVSSLAKRPEGV